MQKYEKLEKIGEGNGTTRCSCQIFLCRPFGAPCSAGSSTVSNTHKLRSQHWLQPWPRAQHSLQTPLLPVSINRRRPFPTLALPETYLPTLALPASPAPSLSTTGRAFIHHHRRHPPPQPQWSMQTADLISTGPHFSPRPARYFQNPRKQCLYYRLPYAGSCSLSLLQTPLRRLQAPSLPPPSLAELLHAEPSR